MREDEYLKRIHDEILNVMDVVDSMCRSNGLRYYLIGGTLLGAIRHGGFIPWDDDLDIVMPRSDYNRFIRVCEDQLPQGYKLKWITTEKNYRRLYAKVSNENTKFIEDMGGGNTNDSGIFVDIFPIDETKGYSPILKLRKWIVYKIAIMIGRKLTPGDISRIKKLIIDMFSVEQLFSIAIKTMSYSNGRGYEFYSNFGSQYPIKRRTIEKICLGDGVEIKFEDRMYFAPSDSIAVVKNIFGENYMELPPIEKRKTHYPVYVKFSDGTELVNNSRLFAVYGG